MLQQYVQLTKPGIIRGNAMTAAAGFFMAAGLAGSLNWAMLLATILGTSLVVACGCVINNVLDRDIDARMKRTKSRATVTGSISLQNALLFAGILGLAGFFLLIAFVNMRVAFIGLFGLFFYAIVYTFAKRVTHHSTLIGALPGAVPPVAGYVAVTNTFDTTALILFLVMIFWQMPHFYGIALYRSKEYTKVNIPLLPLVKGEWRTKLEMLLYTTAFGAATLSLAVYAKLGYLYVAVMALVSFGWLFIALRGLLPQDSALWGRKMFLSSLIVILVWSLAISLSPSLYG